MKRLNYVRCKNCSWVSFTVSLEYCIDWENKWKVYWKKLSPKDRDSYGCKARPPTIEMEYLNCFLCRGSYKDFVKAKSKDLPRGSTAQGILSRKYAFDRSKL